MQVGRPIMGIIYTKSPGAHAHTQTRGQCVHLTGVCMQTKTVMITEYTCAQHICSLHARDIVCACVCDHHLLGKLPSRWSDRHGLDQNK
jgi:hypothetical protein